MISLGIKIVRLAQSIWTALTLATEEGELLQAEDGSTLEIEAEE